ncbi:MAG: HEPN domain-containing protein [Actinomycetota bacterium]
MNERPETLDERVARWIRWAREDLVLAECAHADKDAVPRGACAWAQQCAEKTLKAVIVAQGIDPPKTHNLLTLEQLMPDSVKTALVDLDLEELTRWSIQGRYPGISRRPRQPTPSRRSRTRRRFCASSRRPCSPPPKRSRATSEPWQLRTTSGWGRLSAC